MYVDLGTHPIRKAERNWYGFDSYPDHIPEFSDTE
jgi:hypothetical protein